SLYVASEVIVGFFFFQAEDGIRDFHVVQTCALPISRAAASDSRARGLALRWAGIALAMFAGAVGLYFAGADRGLATTIAILMVRSEERRVGKEGRSRGWPDHWKKEWERESDAVWWI